MLTVNADGDTTAHESSEGHGKSDENEGISLAVGAPVLLLALDGALSHGEVVILTVVTAVIAIIIIGALGCILSVRWIFF